VTRSLLLWLVLIKPGLLYGPVKRAMFIAIVYLISYAGLLCVAITTRGDRYVALRVPALCLWGLWLLGTDSGCALFMVVCLGRASVVVARSAHPHDTVFPTIRVALLCRHSAGDS